MSTPFVAVPPRGYGGTELVVAELQRELSRAGHEVTLFATGDSRGEDVRWLYPSAVWPPDPDHEVAHCAFAARHVAREPFDVVHTHCAPMLHFSDRMGKPIVHTIHHAHDEELSSVYRLHPEVRFVAISRRQAELEDVPCAVVHHGLDPGRYPLGAGEGGYAFFLGRLAWCKGPDLAIDAARAAGVEIVVAGRSHERDADPPAWRDRELFPRLRASGVRWIGPARAQAKRALLGAARALLVPIRWEEPFGLVMIEAMLCGCPVLAFSRGAAPELVDEGVTGWLVRDVGEMADRLRALDGFDRRACRDRARERFSSGRMARAYLQAYAAAARSHAAVAGAGEWAPPR